MKIIEIVVERIIVLYCTRKCNKNNRSEYLWTKNRNTSHQGTGFAPEQKAQRDREK